MSITLSDSWTTTHPDAHAGILTLQNVRNPRHHPELERRKRALEAELRARYDGYTKNQLRKLPVLAAYRAYYKRFRKSYHVWLQLRSVALEGKSLPSVAALVEASFMAELKNGLLTAAHDRDKIVEPVTLTVARGDERYVTLNGREQTLKADDMIMTDAQGVICSVIYGLARRAAMGPGTRRALFVVYAPAGIAPPAIRSHLEEIRDLARLIAPAATVEALEIYP